MRGHTRKRGKTWCIVFDEGRNEDGRRVQRWQSGFATKKDADLYQRHPVHAAERAAQNAVRAKSTLPLANGLQMGVRAGRIPRLYAGLKPNLT